MHDGMGGAPLVHIIDDDESVRRSLDFVLRTSGYRTERWPSGEDFLRSADPYQKACILLDICMPGRGGIQIQRAMAENGFDCPVIILTGHGDIDVAVTAMKAGAFDFIEKPFERDRLIGTLVNAFESIKNRSVLRQNSDWAQVQLARLTVREFQVLNGLACGFPNKTIAYDLGISTRTVEVYRANLMMKLEVGSFADVLRIAFAAGLGADWNVSPRSCGH